MPTGEGIHSPYNHGMSIQSMQKALTGQQVEDNGLNMQMNKGYHPATQRVKAQMARKHIYRLSDSIHDQENANEDQGRCDLSLQAL